MPQYARTVSLPAARRARNWGARAAGRVRSVATAGRLGDGLRRQQQRAGGQLAQALQRQQRVRRVVEHARAPHDVVRADGADRRRLVQVALHEAHLGVAPRDLRAEAVGRAHDVDAGDAGGAGVLGGEAQRAVDRPHAADRRRTSGRRSAGDQRLARRSALHRAPRSVRRREGDLAEAATARRRRPAGRSGRRTRCNEARGAMVSSASSGLSRARSTTSAVVHRRDSSLLLLNNCMNCRWCSRPSWRRSPRARDWSLTRPPARARARPARRSPRSRCAAPRSRGWRAAPAVEQVLDHHQRVVALLERLRVEEGGQAGQGLVVVVHGDREVLRRSGELVADLLVEPVDKR